MIQQADETRLLHKLAMTILRKRVEGYRKTMILKNRMNSIIFYNETN